MSLQLLIGLALFGFLGLSFCLMAKSADLRASEFLSEWRNERLRPIKAAFAGSNPASLISKRHEVLEKCAFALEEALEHLEVIAEQEDHGDEPCDGEGAWHSEF